MFHLPPQSDAHWVYDDPSGVPEPTQFAQPAQPRPVELPKRGKIVRFPFPLPKPATPKAA
jgi:hypothetical protein